MMTNLVDLHDLLASVFRYPCGEYHRKVDRCVQALTETCPAAGDHLRKYAQQIQGRSFEEMEELYTHTFDLNPACSLEVGWHLHGENYARGEFLVWMRRELRRLDIPESTDLPDHLTHALPVLGRLDPDAAAEFATTAVLPALEKMKAGLAGKNNPYEDALAATLALVQHRHGSVLRKVNHGEPLSLS